MRILLKTKVKGNYKSVMERFDRGLFEALIPKQGKTEIVEFTGSRKGDRVHLRFISPFKADWTSDITEDHIDDQQAYFVDEGVIMPFGLKTWKHRHIAERIDDNSCYIVDDINYEGKTPLLSLFLYPVFYLGFLPRKGIYQYYFGKA